MNVRQASRSAAACAAAVFTLLTPASAPSYPTTAVKIIVPFPAGGPLDSVARLVADRLTTELKQPFVVENRPGVSGNLGTEAAAKSTPDGHTLLFVLETPLTVHPTLYPSLAFDPQRDFRPITVAARFQQMLVVHPSVPAKSLAEFVAFAKSNRLTYGSGGGRGDPGHLTMEYFRRRAGFEAVHVPYRGNPQVVMDLVGGQVQAGFVALPGVLQHVRDGKLRALAVSSAKRSAAAPEIATVAESGFPNFDIGFRIVLLAPAGTPDPIAALLEDKVRAALKLPDVEAQLRNQSMDPVASTSADARQDLAAAAELWREVIRAANIRLD
jgi:tripartite-type tricarboxylate transporter receptor subunit TctC